MIEWKLFLGVSACTAVAELAILLFVMFRRNRSEFRAAVTYILGGYIALAAQLAIMVLEVHVFYKRVPGIDIGRLLILMVISISIGIFFLVWYLKESSGKKPFPHRLYCIAGCTPAFIVAGFNALGVAWLAFFCGERVWGPFASLAEEVSRGEVGPGLSRGGIVGIIGFLISFFTGMVVLIVGLYLTLGVVWWLMNLARKRLPEKGAKS